MLKNILLFAMGTFFFVSCKKECDSSTQKIGFYYLDTKSQNEEKTTYKLYIDNAYKGDINTLNHVPACGEAGLLYCNLDGKKHDLEVRNAKDELMNSDYLQVTKNKVSSGSGKNSCKVTGQSDGTRSDMKTGDECRTFGFYK